ncbi:MAG: DUF302 domain-containing protein [Asticcacaulis sp.]
MRTRSFFGFFTGALTGVLAALLAVVLLLPGQMITVSSSPYSVEETVQRLSDQAVRRGWVVSGTKALDLSIKKNGGGSVPTTVLLELCQAQHASAILSREASRHLSVLMPCTISVFKADDGSTRVARLNAGLMGHFFGPDVARVFSGPVANEHQAIIEQALLKE